MNTAPYGSWVSPLAIDQLASASIGLGAVRIDGDQVYWMESRADQGGRSSLWRRTISGGGAVELTPSPTYVRDRVHEYGGGDFDVDRGVIIYSDFSDGRLFVLRDDAAAVPLTPAGPLRFGDLRLYADRGLVLAVREDHGAEGEAINTIVALDLQGDNSDGGVVLCSGADFYSTPELSGQGQLAWTEWNHPNMPWDSTMIKTGILAGGRVSDVREIAGGPGESAVAPRWAGEELIFLSDRTQWWNPYCWSAGAVRSLHETDAEFCLPQWQLGQTPYAVLDDHRLLCALNRGGAQTLAVLDTDTSELTMMAGAQVTVHHLAAANGAVAAVLGYPDRPSTLSLLDLDRQAWSDLRTSTELIVDPASISRARPVSWRGPQGEVHGWYYPPTNAAYAAPEGSLPVLITLSHGGPTACATPDFTIAHQFWTTRGYAILDVNYGGSSGYGRAYRDRLLDNWGLVDVRDCADGAAAMGDQGLADPRRLTIKGGSAGGYTTLCALTGTDVFAAGISLFGVGDLELLATDTHKFEARYLDELVGPYPAARERYIERSPIHHADRLSAPILLLQGTEDKVVPPNQTITMADAARAKGLPVAMILFDGEGHGFRRAETIKAATEAQLDFLGRILGFVPADEVPSIMIDNLD